MTWTLPHAPVAPRHDDHADALLAAAMAAHAGTPAARAAAAALPAGPSPWHAASVNVDAPAPAARLPQDQAAGLRRLFAARQLRFVPIVSNPFITFGGVLIERLCSALADMQVSSLVVDASERAAAPAELAQFDLAEGIEPLSPRVSYLAARGLPARHADHRGSTAAFLDAVAEAAPFAQVVLVLGSAIELARLFGRPMPGTGAPRPLVLCDDRAEALTHAYTALKLLAQRADWHAHDLLLCADPASAQAARVAQRLAQCAENFLGGVQRAWVAVDPAESALAEPAPTLVRMVQELVTAGQVHAVREAQPGPGTVLPAPFAGALN
jgi:flagellar biosynthesis protein FlhG